MSTARGHGNGQAGFTLIEMLVAVLIMITITGSVFALLNPVHGVFKSQPEAADVQQRLRVGVDALVQDLTMAGRGLSTGPSAGSLLNNFAPVMPYRVGDAGNDPSAGVFYRQDTISVVYVPSLAAQTTVSEPLLISSQDLTLDIAPNCPPTTTERVCGFGEKTRALLFDTSGAWNAVTVIAVQPPMLQMRYAGSLVTAYDRGAMFSEAVTHTYHLKVDADTYQLMRYDGAQTDLPVVDNIVKLKFSYFGDPQPPSAPEPPPIGADRQDDAWPAGENCAFAVEDGKHVPRLPVLAAGIDEIELPANMLIDGPWCVDAAHSNRFDADLLRIRRIRVTLRLQAGSVSMRGPAGVLFTRGGTSSGQSFVPDQEIRFDVAPRNMNLGR